MYAAPRPALPLASNLFVQFGQEDIRGEDRMAENRIRDSIADLGVNFDTALVRDVTC
jgi:hypothetical protein